MSGVQGGNLKYKREIRVASLFREAPAALLRRIVVHELAHLKEREHDRAFYALCTHMEPDYHQLELDVRLWRTGVEARLPRVGVPRGRSLRPLRPQLSGSERPYAHRRRSAAFDPYA